MQVDEHDDELIERWQWTSPPLRNLDDLALDLLRGERGGGRVLDVGCGSGRLAVRLARVGFSVDGIDPEERVVRLG